MQIRSPYKVGKYGVDVAALDRVAAKEMSAKGADVFLIDEIGKMECCSEAFVGAVGKAFDSGAAILATVPLRGGGPFVEGIRRRRGVE